MPVQKCLPAFVALALALVFSASAALAQGEALVFDQPASGEVTEANPRVEYTFTGTEGDTITITMIATGPGLDPYLELQGPGGEILTTNDDAIGSLNSVIGPFVLPESGAYTVVATRCCPGGGSSVGPFELTLRQAELQPIAVGESVTVQLDDANPFATLTFEASGAAGEVLALSAAPEGNAPVYIELRNPAGQIVNQVWQTGAASLSMDPIVIGADGLYMFTVNRQNMGVGVPLGSASVTLTLESIETQPIAAGDTMTGTLDDSNPSDHYTFSGSADQMLRLTGMRGPDDQDFEVIVVSPQGIVISGMSTAMTAEAGRFVLDPLSIFEPGDYLLVVRRIDFTGTGELGPANYELTFGPSEAPTLEAGVEVQGTVGGDVVERVFRYDGTEGQTIRITLGSEDENYAPSMSVEGPRLDTMPLDMIGGVPRSFIFNVSGATQATATYEFVVPASGLYLIRVNNSAVSTEGAARGNFRLLVEVME